MWADGFMTSANEIDYQHCDRLDAIALGEFAAARAILSKECSRISNAMGAFGHKEFQSKLEADLASTFANGIMGVFQTGIAQSVMKIPASIAAGEVAELAVKALKGFGMLYEVKPQKAEPYKQADVVEQVEQVEEYPLPAFKHKKLKSSTQSSSAYHEVITGDTIYDLGIKYGKTEAELLEANPWLKDRAHKDAQGRTIIVIKAGVDRLVIPGLTQKGLSFPKFNAKNPYVDSFYPEPDLDELKAHPDAAKVWKELEPNADPLLKRLFMEYMSEAVQESLERGKPLEFSVTGFIVHTEGKYLLAPAKKWLETNYPNAIKYLNVALEFLGDGVKVLVDGAIAAGDAILSTPPESIWNDPELLEVWNAGVEHRRDMIKSSASEVAAAVHEWRDGLTSGQQICVDALLKGAEIAGDAQVLKAATKAVVISSVKAGAALKAGGAFARDISEYFNMGSNKLCFAGSGGNGLCQRAFGISEPLTSKAKQTADTLFKIAEDDLISKEVRAAVKAAAKEVEAMGKTATSSEFAEYSAGKVIDAHIEKLAAELKPYGIDVKGIMREAESKIKPIKAPEMKVAETTAAVSSTVSHLDVQKFGPIAAELAEHPVSKPVLIKWGIGEDGTNQLFKHTLGKASDPQRLPGLEARAGLNSGTLVDVYSKDPHKAAAALKNFDDLAQKVKSNAAQRFSAQTEKGVKEGYYIPSVKDPRKGIGYIEYNGKPQSLMETRQKSFEGLFKPKK